MQRPAAGTIPDRPGSYQFRDAHDRIIYVGKAKSLRSRLASYFANPKTLHPRTAQMMSQAASVEWIEVRTELEAMMLEYNLIKANLPRYNIRLIDDRSYPFLAITTSDKWPRALVWRGARRRDTRYFGPYISGFEIREILDFILRTIPVRTCSDGKFRRHERMQRPCLLYHIEKCAGPCASFVDEHDYQELVKQLMRFLDGETGEVLARLDDAMQRAAETLDFERAAKMRDRKSMVSKALERQAMVGKVDENFDIFGLHVDMFEAAVQVFYVRRGRVVGRKGFLVDIVEDLSTPQLMQRIVERHYQDDPPLGIPRDVYVPELPHDESLLREYLQGIRDGVVHFHVPRRGGKRELAQTVTQNAQQELARHRLRRSTDHDSRARAMRSLQDALALPNAPLRIECFDMSHIQGTDYVGSMVVMEDALPRKAEYRRFKVKTVAGNDDFAAMEEVLRRRFTALLNERKDTEKKRKKFSYPPSLLLVDGGKGQLSVAMRVLDELGLRSEIPVASLAKQFEEVFVPGQSAPIRLPRQSEALFLLQRVRDEAHRFAITFHRERRGKRMTKSALDDIAGLGPSRKKRLLGVFGSVGAIKAAERDALRAQTWLPNDVADAVYARFHGDEAEFS